MHGYARGSGLETTALAASAYYLVVEEREVSELARKTGMAVEELPVEYYTYAEAPAHVDAYDVFLVVAPAAHVLAVGHGARIVLDVDVTAQTLLKQSRKGFVFRIEVAETVSARRVHTSRQVDAYRKYFLACDAETGDRGVNQIAQLIERRFGFGERKRNLLPVLDKTALEIYQAETYMVVAYIDPEEVAGVGIEPVQVGAAPAAGTLFAEVVNESFVYKFGYEFGYGRDAQAHFTAQIGQAAIAASQILTYDSAFDYGILVAFAGKFQE